MLNGVKCYREKIKQGKADGKQSSGGRWGIILVKDDPIEKMVFEQRYERGEGTNKTVLMSRARLSAKALRLA